MSILKGVWKVFLGLLVGSLVFLGSLVATILGHILSFVLCGALFLVLAFVVLTIPFIGVLLAIGAFAEVWSRD